jgi:hypothetical protein
LDRDVYRRAAVSECPPWLAALRHDSNPSAFPAPPPIHASGPVREPDERPKVS